MKKYTQKLVAFLLAVAMALTGLPMSATEVKAADSDVIYYRFDRPTTGATLIGGDGAIIGLDETSENASYYMTTSLAGDGWTLNTTETDVPTQEENPTLYWNAGTSSSSKQDGAHLQKWASGNRIAYWFNYSNTLAFDIVVPETGTYVVEVYYLDHKNHKAADVAFNGNVLGTIPANASGADTSAIIGTTVDLNAGTNLVEFTTSGTSYLGSTLKYMTLSKIGYGEATINLEEGAMFNVGDTLTLDTTATLSNGTDITNDISVAYASTDTSVATVTDNVLSIVGEGNAAITATVTYNGAEAEVITRNISAIVEGTFWFDFTDVDDTTLLNDSSVEGFTAGSNRLYTIRGTKSVSTATVPWVLNEELSDKAAFCTGEINAAGTGLVNATGRFFNKPGDITSFRIMQGNVPFVFDFTAPAAGEYNLSAEVIIGGEKFGYGSVFVNGEYVGTVDGYTGMPKYQKLLSATVNEGTNTLKVIAAGASSGTDDYIGFVNIKFSPVETGRKATSLDLTVDTTELDMAGTTTAQASITATADDDVLLIGDYTFASSNEEVAVVARTGKITAKSAGTTDITTTIGELTDTVTVTVADTRPTITWANEDGSVITTDRVAVGGTAEFDGDTPVKEGDAQYSYTFAGWTTDGETLVEDFTVAGDATYTAVYTETVNTYTVTWSVNGVETTETYAYGTVPTAPTVNPYEEEGVAYVFKGWDAEIVAVTGDVTYTAVFEAAAQSYTISFVDEDGTPLYETQAEAGEVVTYPYEAPTKAGNAQYSYAFAGWTVDGETLVEDFTVSVGTTYTAVYTETVNTYTVTWLNADGSELEVDEVAYGEVPTYDGETPVKAADETFTYEFSGWDREVEAVTGATEYYAQYEATAIEYTVVFLDENGAELSRETYGYGAEVVVPEDPSKEADAQYTYTFAGWSPEVAATVEGDATYTATYDATVNEYEIIFLDEDGTELSRANVAYGTVPTCEAPSKEGNEQYTYTFAGWDPEVVAVEGEATYTATYEATPVLYTITWVNHNGETIATDELEWGATPEAPAATYKEYAFLAWDAEVVAVEGEATYKAIYDIDGIDEGYYYVDGILQSENAQLIKIGEDLYYVQHSGAIKKDGNQTISKIRTNGYVEAGTYYFNAEGIMINPADDLTGTIGEDGYYYVKGEVRQNVGLVEIDGYYYYVLYSGKVVKGQNMTVPASQLNDYEVEAGTYYFFANGIMETQEVRMSGSVEDGKYYVFGELRKNAGLVQLANGDFIFVQYSGNVRQSGFQTIKEATCNGFTEYIGIKKFAEGVMVK